MMMRIRKGEVHDIFFKDERIAVVNIIIKGILVKTINYNMLTGDIKAGDIVYVNNTSNYLKLGSGGYDFVIINESTGTTSDIDDEGHIMKLNYTPYQIKCHCISEREGIYREKIDGFKSLNNMAVIVGELHSMLSPIACCLKYLKNNIKIAYIMTDRGCLPIDFSDSVRELKQKGILACTITCGNAFGGDIEAVNIYDALVAAKGVLSCDIAIVTMGPGIIGTGTKYGFSGVEQGHIIDCINTLKGTPVFTPRISFADKRERHYGISHHTLTILSEISNTSANVVFPILEAEKMDFLFSQIHSADIMKKHILKFVSSDILHKALSHYKTKANTMGRGIEEDKEFFMTCQAAAFYSYFHLKE
ncbi:hypothetical protein OXPF_13580 [Oxobacter pfennigii]|uniref:DUF3866 domain-containing protein n=1 Tax=Oxobacter pfennigii TaxID=36849 RepID=A0A0N8NTH9_9CLOT|nr:DUF3866 family protein [Oxobacter pfennigii]KPU44880.1 hypothetical protein OXPF_13580 [Oxobacter pfennigii]